VEIEDRQPDETKAEETNEYVGDEHSAIVKAWLGFKLLAADFAYPIHFQRMHDIQFAKHMSLTATGTGQL